MLHCAPYAFALGTVDVRQPDRHDTNKLMTTCAAETFPREMGRFHFFNGNALERDYVSHLGYKGNVWRAGMKNPPQR